jgi:hypothetical protein
VKPLLRPASPLDGRREGLARAVAFLLAGRLERQARSPHKVSAKQHPSLPRGLIIQPLSHWRSGVLPSW